MEENSLRRKTDNAPRKYPLSKPTSVTCEAIVMKDGEFFQGIADFLGGTRKFYKFSRYMFDAKRFKTPEKAKDAAEKIGGVVRFFDALNGNLI